MNIESLLKQPEGKRLEFKRDLSSPIPVMKTLAAFANTAGGTLLIGIEDEKHNVVGIDNPMEFEQRLANLITDRLEPRLVPEIEIIPWRSTYVIAVEVHLSPNRPHYLADEGPKEGAYVRLGSTNRRADPALIAEMERSTRYESFDEMPMVDLNSEAIDFRAVSELFRPHREIRRRDLQTLGFMTKHQGQVVPTIGGVLLFGNERHSLFPDARLQAARFAGIDRSHIADHFESGVHLPVLVEEAVAFLDRHLARSFTISGTRRTEIRQLPLVALREVVVNAIVHTDYSQPGGTIAVAMFDDRVEVENPGLLPFGLTVEDIRHGVSRVRNRVIARTFRELGYIEQWGSGIQRMTNACKEAGLDEPELLELAGRFRVTLRFERTRAALLDNVDEQLLGALRENNGMTTSEVAAVVSRSTRATRTRLASLIERGLVIEVGTGANDPRRKYHAIE